MSDFEARIAEVLVEHAPSRWRSFTNENLILRCCGQDFGNFAKKAKRDDDAKMWDAFAAHQAAALVPVIREEMRGAFGWMSEAITEAAQKAPAPSSTPDLASAYWDGLRTASREVSDLLVEPKLIEKAINHRSNDAHTN